MTGCGPQGGCCDPDEGNAQQSDEDAVGAVWPGQHCAPNDDAASGADDDGVGEQAVVEPAEFGGRSSCDVGKLARYGSGIEVVLARWIGGHVAHQLRISVTVLMHDGNMNEHEDFSIDCKTCIGAGTTACNDCFVTHLLANDDGPIDYVPVVLSEVRRLPDPQEVAISLFIRSGLVDDPIQLVPVDEFTGYGVPVHA